MNIELSREEVLACIITLERSKEAKGYGWFYSALVKLLKAMDMKATVGIKNERGEKE